MLKPRFFIQEIKAIFSHLFGVFFTRTISDKFKLPFHSKNAILQNAHLHCDEFTGEDQEQH